MNRTFQQILTVSLLLWVLNACSDSSEAPSESDSVGNKSDGDADTDTDGDADGDTDTDADTDTYAAASFDISVQYTQGTDTDPAIIYAIWLESAQDGYLAPLYVCGRLRDGSLTNTALPYWSMNRMGEIDTSDVDAVTGATVQFTDFTVTQSVNTPKLSTLDIYVEMDHSFDSNDWFSDQPAILYGASIDLPVHTETVPLNFLGWTPNEGTNNVIDGAVSGALQTETRYITHYKDGDGFGGEDPRSSTNMIGTLTASIVAK